MFFDDLMDQVKKGEEIEQQKIHELHLKKKDTHKVLKEQHDQMKV